MVMEVRTHQAFLVIFLVLVCGCPAPSSFVVNGATLEEQCSTLFSKVAACLTFATAKADAPTKECCTNVGDIKEKDPVCLCFIIQQVHKGDPNLKSMGIQEARLLQLPSACKLTNASSSDCPRLLHLPPNSPDAAIFTNSTSSSASPATPSTPASSSSSSPSTTTTAAGSSSDGFKHAPRVAAPAALALAIVFLCVFPSGVVSRFLA